MTLILVLAQAITIVSAPPPLTPAQAVAVLQSSSHVSDVTKPDPRWTRSASQLMPTPPDPPARFVPSRPLNCCTTYVHSPRGIWIDGVQVAGEPRTGWRNADAAAPRSRRW